MVKIMTPQYTKFVTADHQIFYIPSVQYEHDVETYLDPETCLTDKLFLEKGNTGWIHAGYDEPWCILTSSAGLYKLLELCEKHNMAYRQADYSRKYITLPSSHNAITNILANYCGKKVSVYIRYYEQFLKGYGNGGIGTDVYEINYIDALNMYIIMQLNTLSMRVITDITAEFKFFQNIECF